MRVTHFENNDFSSAKAAVVLAEALQPYLDTPVVAADAVTLTGLPLEQARTALAYLAVRNVAQVTFVGDEVAYIFAHASASIGGVLPTPARSFTRYAMDLAASQVAYLLGALVAVGPAFIGATMFTTGMETGDPFNLLAGGTLAFASLGGLLHFAVRSLSVTLPPLVFAGIVIGWERWTATDLYWLPLAALVAIAIQADMLMGFRRTRPADSMRLLFWGRGFTEPLRDRKRLAELVTAMGGTVTMGDLMRSFGWTAAEAGEQLANVLIEYGGDVAVNRGGKMYLRFEELAQTKIETDVPVPAYELERSPPGPFRGLDAGWVFIVAVVCWVGLIASPLNPAYTRFVTGIDFTLGGIGTLVRGGFAALCAVPLFVYLGRLLLNIFERPEFAARREFLDAMEYADKHAEGSHVGLEKFSTELLVKLNAQIDEERSIPGAIWVRFPDLRADAAAAEGELMFDVFTSEDEVEMATQAQAAAVARGG